MRLYTEKKVHAVASEIGKTPEWAENLLELTRANKLVKKHSSGVLLYAIDSRHFQEPSSGDMGTKGQAHLHGSPSVLEVTTTPPHASPLHTPLSALEKATANLKRNAVGSGAEDSEFETPKIV